MDPLLSGILATLILSAFFSGIEIAFISADKLHIELRGKKGSLSSRILAQLAKKPSMFIGTTLIGNTITLVIYGSLMTRALEPILGMYFQDSVVIMMLQTLISTLVVLALAEFLPKSLFLISPNKILSFFALPMEVLRWLLAPVTWVVVNFSKVIIVNVFKGEFSRENPVFGLTDLDNYLRDIVGRGADEEEAPDVDAKIFSNALEFKTIKVRECMIPRTELQAVDVNGEMADLKRVFIDSGYSKILIYKESIDNIIGYCHSSQLFKKPKSIEEMTTDVQFVPETAPANELMVDLINSRKSIAVVVDEFGGTSGLVTIEDIIEEIFGEIQDEHDDDGLEEQDIGDGMYIFSARQEINYLNDTYDLSLPTGDYDTLGGLILSNHGEIPKPNDLVEIEPFRMVIKTMDGVKIDRVKVIKTLEDYSGN